MQKLRQKPRREKKGEYHPHVCLSGMVLFNLGKACQFPTSPFSFVFELDCKVTSFHMHAHANLIRGVPPAHSFPPSTLPYCPCLYLHFFTPVFSLQLSVVFCLLPSTHYQKFSSLLKLKKSFARNILKFAVLISCLPLLYQIH